MEKSKPQPIVLVLMLLCSPALACSSYEECMEGATTYVPVGSTHGYVAALKAIAYKLEEISEKLTEPEETFPMPYVPDCLITNFKELEPDKDGRPMYSYDCIPIQDTLNQRQGSFYGTITNTDILKQQE